MVTDVFNVADPIDFYTTAQFVSSYKVRVVIWYRLHGDQVNVLVFMAAGSLCQQRYIFASLVCYLRNFRFVLDDARPYNKWNFYRPVFRSVSESQVLNTQNKLPVVQTRFLFDRPNWLYNRTMTSPNDRTCDNEVGGRHFAIAKTCEAYNGKHIVKVFVIMHLKNHS
jgi:hypothetical protein